MPVLCIIHRILLILGAVRFSANEKETLHQIFVLLKELLLRMTKRILLSINNFPYHIMEGNGVGNHRLQHLIGLTDPREQKGGAPGKGAGKRSREKKKRGQSDSMPQGIERLCAAWWPALHLSEKEEFPRVS